eukprot:13340353-Alexandrium_andersonii.AAC.2
MRAEDIQRVATQGNLQGVTPSASPFAAPVPTAIPRPAKRLLTPLPRSGLGRRAWATSQARSLPFVKQRNE